MCLNQQLVYNANWPLVGKIYWNNAWLMLFYLNRKKKHFNCIFVLMVWDPDKGVFVFYLTCRHLQDIFCQALSAAFPVFLSRALARALSCKRRTRNKAPGHYAVILFCNVQDAFIVNRWRMQCNFQISITSTPFQILFVQRVISSQAHKTVYVLVQWIAIRLRFSRAATEWFRRFVFYVSDVQSASDTTWPAKIITTILRRLREIKNNHLICRAGLIRCWACWLGRYVVQNIACLSWIYIYIYIHPIGTRFQTYSCF